MRLTSLLLVEERLFEAEYFCTRMRRARGSWSFGYDLNAFLSAARSTTFLMQKELSKVPGFADWWRARRARLGADPSARFFLELRNFSQKEGRVSLVGSRTGTRHWTHRFAGGGQPVPTSLLHRDVVDCCREHLAKLAAVTLDCVEAFPYASCPARALTREGVDALRLTPADIAAATGLPLAWMDVGDAVPWSERLRILRGHVDAVDIAAIQRLASFRPRRRREARRGSARLGQAMLTSVVNRMEGGRIDVLGVAADLLTDVGSPDGGD